jgi:threonine/homoserine/homoserine lactone efflux protein
MIISFLGSLSPSALNLTAMQISLHESISIAMYFSLGTIVTEIIYVRLCLGSIAWLRKQKKFLTWLEWITVVLITSLSIGSFIAASRTHHTQNVILDNTADRFLLGAFMSAVTPMHIPFWLGWSTVLFTKKILSPDSKRYFIYIIGIALGTFMANGLYILSGKYVVDIINTNESIINIVIGGVFAITAIIQVVKIVYHKDAAAKLETVGKSP